MLTRTDTALDRPMILFQDVGDVHRSMSTVLPQNTVGFELNDGWRMSRGVGGSFHAARGGALCAQSRGETVLRCGGVVCRQKEVDRRPAGGVGGVVVVPPAADPDVCLVDPPRVIGRFEPRAQTRSNSGA